MFGPKRFRNEITWKRFNFHADAKRFGALSDRVLFYTNGDNYGFSRVRVPYSKEYIDSKFTYTEPDGRRFSLDNLNPPGGRGPVYEFHGITRAWRFREDKMRRLDAEGRIHHAGKTPRIKRYLDEMPGQAVADIWHDIPPINSQAKERVGYPTQKPLALLERIIRASSNEGDIVLDPFAGCATSCVAAERLGRQWVGIDLSAKAVELVQVRLKQQEPGIALWASQVVARTDVPRRTDIDAPKNYRQNKHVLYGGQEGRCNGCQMHFQFKTLTVDHAVPQSKGGTDHLENLQLLCGHCNSVKGNRPQEYLIARLTELQAVRS